MTRKTTGKLLPTIAAAAFAVSPVAAQLPDSHVESIEAESQNESDVAEQPVELSTECSALKTALKANAILAKNLAARMKEAEKAEDFKRVLKIMQASAALADAASSVDWKWSTFCDPKKQAEQKRQEAERERQEAKLERLDRIQEKLLQNTEDSLGIR